MLTLASRLPFHSWLLLESEGPLRRHMIILPETHAWGTTGPPSPQLREMAESRSHHQEWEFRKTWVGILASPCHQLPALGWSQARYPTLQALVSPSIPCARKTPPPWGIFVNSLCILSGYYYTTSASACTLVPSVTRICVPIYSHSPLAYSRSLLKQFFPHPLSHHWLTSFPTKRDSPVYKNIAILWLLSS